MSLISPRSVPRQSFTSSFQATGSRKGHRICRKLAHHQRRCHRGQRESLSQRIRRPNSNQPPLSNATPSILREVYPLRLAAALQKTTAGQHLLRPQNHVLRAKREHQWICNHGGLSNWPDHAHSSTMDLELCWWI